MFKELTLHGLINVVIASSPGHSQILSCSCGENWENGIVATSQARNGGHG